MGGTNQFTNSLHMFGKQPDPEMDDELSIQASAERRQIEAPLQDKVGQNLSGIAPIGTQTVTEQRQAEEDEEAQIMQRNREITRNYMIGFQVAP